MILIRFAIGTFSLALLAMALTVGPPASQHAGPAPPVAVMHH